MKRISAARCGSVPSSLRAIEHERARGARRAVGAEGDLVEQPHRQRAPAARLQVEIENFGLELARRRRKRGQQRAPSPATRSDSFNPPEPTCARSWSSQLASVALR